MRAVDPGGGGRGRTRGRAARRHAGAVALRLSARGPGAATGVPRGLRARTRGAGRKRRARPRWSSAFPSRPTAGATTRWRWCETGASPRSIASSGCPITRYSTRSAISTPGDAPCVFDVDGMRGRAHHLRGLLVPRARAAGEGGRRASSSSWPTARRITRGSRRCAASRSARGHARRGLPVVYVNRVGGQDELVFDGASFVVDADGRRGAAAAGVARNGGDGDVRQAAPQARARRARPAAGVARLRGAGDGRARLRRQERLSGRAAGLVGRHRFGADARGGRRCARARTACAR